MAGTILQPFSSLAFTDGTNPIQGYQGEFQEAFIVQANAVPLTSGTTINLLTLNLLAGDWDLSIAVNFGTGLLTLSNTIEICTSLTAQTLNLDPRSGYIKQTNTLSVVLPRPRYKIVVSNDPSVVTPVYVVLKASFTLSTLSAWGMINGRRPI